MDRECRVLLIESGKVDALALCHMLADVRDPRFEVTRAASLAMGLDRLRGDAVFDVLMLNLTLPDSDGLDTFLKLRAAAPQVPMVVLGRVDDEAVSVSAVRAGAQDYLVQGQVEQAMLVRSLRYAIERQRSEQQLRESQERLVQAERLAAMAQAMAGLAHESRNALQRGQASLERLARRLKDQPESLKLIGNIQQAQDDLYHLYEEVREFAKPLRIRTESHDVRSVVRDAWRQLARLRRGRKVKLREHAEGLNLDCDVDAFALRQVFRNILENSLAGEDPVEIDVAYSLAEIDRRAAVCISMRDNGPGIDQEQRERIFDAFFTTKTHGTGLGMAIAQRIIEAHAGQVVVGDSRQQGTEILVTLPRKQV